MEGKMKPEYFANSIITNFRNKVHRPFNFYADVLQLNIGNGLDLLNNFILLLLRYA